METTPTYTTVTGGDHVAVAAAPPTSLLGDRPADRGGNKNGAVQQASVKQVHLLLDKRTWLLLLLLWGSGEYLIRRKKIYRLGSKRRNLLAEATGGALMSLASLWITLRVMIFSICLPVHNSALNTKEETIRLGRHQQVVADFGSFSADLAR